MTNCYQFYTCDCDKDIKYAMTQGDNTQSFNNNFLIIELENTHNIPVSKAIFQAGVVQKFYENPEFPLYVNFTEQDTKLLKHRNIGYLMVYDSENRPVTCIGSIEFYCRNGVIDV